MADSQQPIDIHNPPTDMDIWTSADDWARGRTQKQLILELFVRVAQLTFELMTRGLIGPQDKNGESITQQSQDVSPEVAEASTLALMTGKIPEVSTESPKQQ